MTVVPGCALGREASRSALREVPGQPVQGVARVTAALTDLVRSARHELLSFDDPAGALGHGIPEPFLEFAAACVRAAAVQATTVRRIAPRHGLTHLPAPWLCPGGARVADSIPFKMVVADRTVAAVPLNLELHYNGVLLIRDPVIVQALVRVHRSWWDSGDELSRQAAPDALPPHLQPVLQAMLAGLTDETAATRLGMSGRTYSRRVGELLATLGTTSRFRAGAEAARRGWA
ncbi:DNA-binding response regulator [Streptomyces sp. NBC_01142]|uniref:DNA-binding response regulator n=1 Tax=Streptomyces sp. NBC_01142 TaxID=2975865 RepID=UPI002252B942|nr:DNA-binding response regulator [Streptomyces sp. NBC_01142]MCX4823175.1 DNA-binding response regulator [Streptomyces sp. NBC_01142]